MFWEVYFFMDSLVEIYNDAISKKCYDSIIIKENFYKKLESLMYSFIIKLFFDNLTEENIEEKKLTNINYIKENFGFGGRDLLTEEISDPIKLNFNRNYYLKFKKDIIKESDNFKDYFKDLEELYDLNEVEKHIASKKINFSKTEYISSEIVTKTKIIEEMIKNKIPFNESNENKTKKLEEKVVKEIIEKTMQITNWDVWYSYTSYSFDDLDDLNKISNDLIESGIFKIAMSSNSDVFYKNKEGIQQEHLKISKKGNKGFIINSLEDSNFPKDLDKYQLEGLGQLLSMMNSEYKLFGESSFSIYSFIKGFLEPIEIEQENGTRIFYPCITIYSWGILNITFRTISPPDYEYFVDNFIKNEVNISQHKINNLLISPDWVKLIIYYNLKSKNKIFEKIKHIKDNTQTYDRGDFSFDFYSSEKFTSLAPYFRNLIDLIELGLNRCIKKSNKDFRGFGDYWTLKPSIYILNFLDRPKNKGDMVKKFGGFFGKIFVRIPDFGSNDYGNMLPKDLRTLNDYCLFINKGLFLWVSSEEEKKYGLDLNRGNVVYEKQVIVDFINNFNIQLHKMSDLALYRGNYKKILEEQGKLLLLEELIKTKSFSKYGEVEEMISFCSNELKWEELKEITRTKLEIMENLYKDDVNIKIQLILIALTINTILIPFILEYMDVVIKLVVIVNSIILIYYLNYSGRLNYWKYCIENTSKYKYIVNKTNNLKDRIFKNF